MFQDVLTEPDPSLVANLVEEHGGVVVEYGVVIATIVILLAAVGQPLVAAVIAWFGRMPAGFP